MYMDMPDARPMRNVRTLTGKEGNSVCWELKKTTKLSDSFKTPVKARRNDAEKTLMLDSGSSRHQVGAGSSPVIRSTERASIHADIGSFLLLWKYEKK